MPFSSLPLSKTHEAAKLNAWGAYGDKDERGFLNRQTDAIVAAAAASEIKTGTRVSLNAALDFQGEWLITSCFLFIRPITTLLTRHASPNMAFYILYCSL